MLYKSYIHVKFKLFSVNAVYFTYQLLPGNKCFVSRGALATKADILIFSTSLCLELSLASNAGYHA